MRFANTVRTCPRMPPLLLPPVGGQPAAAAPPCVAARPARAAAAAALSGGSQQAAAEWVPQHCKQPVKAYDETGDAVSDYGVRLSCCVLCTQHGCRCCCCCFDCLHTTAATYRRCLQPSAPLVRPNKLIQLDYKTTERTCIACLIVARSIRNTICPCQFRPALGIGASTTLPMHYVSLRCRNHEKRHLQTQLRLLTQASMSAQRQGLGDCQCHCSRRGWQMPLPTTPTHRCQSQHHIPHALCVS
jgi:hypothetical protein